MPGMEEESNLKEHTPLADSAFTTCTKSFPIMN